LDESCCHLGASRDNYLAPWNGGLDKAVQLTPYICVSLAARLVVGNAKTTPDP
jgi:hypothetical protein